MLMLLKPWCQLDRDLKHHSQTWQTTLANYVDANPSIRFILSNIQYYHNARAFSDGDVNCNAREADHAELIDDDGLMDESNPLVMDGTGRHETLLASSNSHHTNHQDNFFAQTANRECEISKGL